MYALRGKRWLQGAIRREGRGPHGDMRPRERLSLWAARDRPPGHAQPQAIQVASSTMHRKFLRRLNAQGADRASFETGQAGLPHPQEIPTEGQTSIAMRAKLQGSDPGSRSKLRILDSAFSEGEEPPIESAGALQNTAELSVRSDVEGSWQNLEVNANDSPQDGPLEGGIWTTAALVMGTAVGPGILGLPAATLSAGLIPATAVIIAAWAYVMASILLVVELSAAVISETGGQDVSFTGLAVRTLGSGAGLVVAAVYAALNYALLVACIAGLGEIISAMTKSVAPASLASVICTAGVSLAVLCTPFHFLDKINRILCALMLTSSGLLLALGLPHVSFQAATSRSNWTPSALLPAVPITVLTLGFHVITPLICSLLRGNVEKARRAVLLGGIIPLGMVLAWNTVVLGIAPAPSAGASVEPMSLLLSLGTSAAPCVQAFAFSALGTTLIGYALSFPKQLSDTIDMWQKVVSRNTGQGIAWFGLKKAMTAGTAGAPHSLAGPPEDWERLDSGASEGTHMAAVATGSAGESVGGGNTDESKDRAWVYGAAILPPLVLAGLCPTVFASALDFAGNYANCFLFGVLPPAMAWVMRYGSPVEKGQDGRKAKAVSNSLVVPGGKPVLALLLIISLFLGLRPPP